MNGVVMQKQQTAEEMTAYIDTASAYDQERRYKTDPIFARFYDWLNEQRQRARTAQTEQPTELTADQWRQIPYAEAMRRYRSDSRFRAAVDRLSKANLI
jgi:hypothetical protein